MRKTLLENIKFGQTISYGDLAELVNNRGLLLIIVFLPFRINVYRPSVNCYLLLLVQNIEEMFLCIYHSMSFVLKTFLKVKSC